MKGVTHFLKKITKHVLPFHDIARRGGVETIYAYGSAIIVET
jgi:hypothetical protein